MIVRYSAAVAAQLAGSRRLPQELAGQDAARLTSPRYAAEAIIPRPHVERIIGGLVDQMMEERAA